MFLNQLEIGPESRAREIVELDYRTAAVFDEFGIRYCCGLQLPLEEVCAGNGSNLDELLSALHKASRNVSLSSGTPYDNWSVDFLVDYITNIHHQYLFRNLPAIAVALDGFVLEHKNRFPAFSELNRLFAVLQQTFPEHLRHEEEIIFPYLRQVAHAYQDGDTGYFAKLLVKTLRKPLGGLLEQEHQMLSQSILRFRELTDNYAPVAGACPSHRVILGKLRELDNDMVQHFYLENEVLIPKVIGMEQRLLEKNG